MRRTSHTHRFVNVPYAVRLSNIMNLLHVLDHIPLTHPTISTESVTTWVGTLEWGWMFLLQVDFQELLVLECVFSILIATLKGTRMPNCVVNIRILSIGINVVVVSDMLTEVILALESVVSSISAIAH